MTATAELRCGSCGKLTPPGKFCIHCGAPTQQTCSSCGEAIVPGARFCLECGTPVTGSTASAKPPIPAPAAASERRLVSVLFADLVGFTSFSEHRDPEEVRELLSRYFDRSRSLIDRYGGTVEKFIGDAVMAVWGTPVAREDDAERAVRAALALTGAVSLLGDEVGMPELRVRAGVLTGNAAVEVGAEGEGMVLGDTVNTASRLQSIASPGSVLVDDVTRRASEAAIAYEDAGEHKVKGREQPVHAWTALRVVAGAGGARRSAGLEAPFVGRERELANVIECFEQVAERRHAQLVTVSGNAGFGKSRLLWEFFKYIDGVQRLVRWHQGRCLSYGEGVAYWALAEMVRSRAGIFLQALLRSVALSTLSRRDRKAKHLAVARQLATSWGDEAGDIAEVLASHYLDAVEAEPEAEDAELIRALACQTLEEAGKRAISLALGPEARRHFEQAANLAIEPDHRGRLLGDAGSAAQASGDLPGALALVETAAEVLSTAGVTREAARIESVIAQTLAETGQMEPAMKRLADAYTTLDDGSEDEALAEVASARARLAFLAGDHAEAQALADVALVIAEGLRLVRVLIHALMTKANVMIEEGRVVEGTALLSHATSMALDQDLGAEAVRGLYNLAEDKMAAGRFAEAEELLERGLAVANRRGDRHMERWLVAQGLHVRFMLGRWDEALANAQALRGDGRDDQWSFQALVLIPWILVNRGQMAQALELLDPLSADTGWAEFTVMAQSARAVILREMGEATRALGDARQAALSIIDRSLSHTPVEFAEAVECAFDAEETDVVRELLARIDLLKPVQLIPLLDAEAMRARGRLAAHEGDRESAERWFRRSIDVFREQETRFLLARALLQYAELLGAGEEARALREEAVEVFQALGAAPWLERARAGATEAVA